SSLSKHELSNNMKLIEIHANEDRINKRALDPLGRIIEEYIVLIFDLNGDIKYANQEYLKLVKKPLDQIIGIDNVKNDYKLNGEHFWQEIWSVISNERIWHGEIGIKSADGVTLWIDMFIFPLSLISNDNDGYICFGTDITGIKNHNFKLQSEIERKDKAIMRAEGMLFHSDRMSSLGVISSGIAHEINNPISYIFSNINTLNTKLNKCSFVINDVLPLLIDHKNVLSKINEIKTINDEVTDIAFDTITGIDRIRRII